jgi:eukaryotic-like serine/threonine-protein kinase
MIKKIILFLTPLLILTILFLIIVLIVNRESGKGALQVTSVPDSQVFLDGKFIGKTPLCLCDLEQLVKVGEYSIKIVPTKSGFKEYEQKIQIYQGVLTVVDRTFDKKASAATGSIITLSDISDKEKSEVLVVSFPTGAQVVLDSNVKGETPLEIKDVTPSDHEIKLLKDGYKEKVIKVKTIPGKRLEAIVNLGIRTDLTNEIQKASPSASAVK